MMDETEMEQMVERWMTAYEEHVRSRERHIAEVGYVQLTRDVIETIRRYCPLVEIGAGTGAMAHAVRQAGGRVVATDDYSSHGIDGWWGSCGPVLRAEASRVVRLVSRFNVNLMCSWPSYDESWCYDALRLLPVDRFFVYIGEGEGGCCGDDQLHDLLASDFEVIEQTFVEQFDAIHDGLTVYRRRK